MKDRTLECLSTYLAVTNKPSSSISSRNIAFSYSESAAIAAICRNFNADQFTLAPGPLDPEKRALLKNLLYIPNNLLAAYVRKNVLIFCCCCFIFLFIYLPQNTNNNKIKQNSNTKANKSGEEAQKKPLAL